MLLQKKHLFRNVVGKIKLFSDNKQTFCTEKISRLVSLFSENPEGRPRRDWPFRKKNKRLSGKSFVIILDFDDEKKYFALGLKQLTPHPRDILDQNQK
jgi:hypothetical protein